MQVGAVGMFLYLGIDPKRKAGSSYLVKYSVNVGGIFFRPLVLKEFPHICSIETVEK